MRRRRRERSGGHPTKGRPSLSRALASGKELILADEPSANLDAATTALVVPAGPDVPVQRGSTSLVPPLADVDALVVGGDA
ncbi:hypothetical protein [Cellulosimicrobium cellulans]|uniref:hypothetical protein n=1 Tax=Cellulosimicrobium cellulans TaxID=1710 RepID=UPI0024059ABC|nr:hypothetical protein [Cellulosimicrobium cellulans]MDF9877819.1 ABC-type phosphate/phosphonate transport system ATPase subunit [Cellulosimicrobium cellulans]